MLATLPNDVVRLIGQHVYDTLALTQEERLAHGIFTAVIGSKERRAARASLLSLACTCRAFRAAVRPLLFRCVSVSSVAQAEELMRADWAVYVRILKLSLAMFNSDRARSCWIESALLSRAIDALPNLAHLSLDADASDDSTLALLFASLIPRTDALPPAHVTNPTQVSFANRLRSLAWRERHVPPPQMRTFEETSAFISIHHVLAHAPNLDFLVLDADGGMDAKDVLAALQAIERPVSLMLHGKVERWEAVPAFLGKNGVRELFIDAPLDEMREADGGLESAMLPAFLSLLERSGVTLLQVGSYTFNAEEQRSIARVLARIIPSLQAIGLTGEDDKQWWGIWRPEEEGKGERLLVQPLRDGDLVALEQGRAWPATSSLSSVSPRPRDGE